MHATALPTRPMSTMKVKKSTPVTRQNGVLLLYPLLTMHAATEPKQQQVMAFTLASDLFVCF